MERKHGMEKEGSVEIDKESDEGVTMGKTEKDSRKLKIIMDVLPVIQQ